MSRFLCVILFVLCFHHVIGKHIVGGVLTYECLGSGEYRFTMKIYRDCSADGAGFDINAPFTIYKGNSRIPLITLRASPLTVTDIEPVVSPCLQLPDYVCVEEGIYIFNYRFTDWPSSQSYHISYQRCCRNESVTNIARPGEVGATFTVEITPAAQLLCNNSPVYNAFPPIVICGNQPLSYTHNAYDADGDQLVYELCAPLRGGGLVGLNSGNPRVCDGITPDPACPPPYNAITFVNPPYSPLNPMGGKPPVTIHPVTGILSGFPTTLGQFTVGVCVNEFRNGQLLSTIRRDFQFNVADCEPLVDVQLAGYNVNSIDNDYEVKTCNGLTIPFINQSRDRKNINDYWWEFYIGDSTRRYDSWDATVTFPKAGNYTGMLRLNHNTPCSDSAKIFVEILPELVADYAYKFDTCKAGPVSFFNRSQIMGGGQITRFKWNFGDGSTDTIQNNPVHVYKEAGIIPTTLEVWDKNNCSDKTTLNVYYRPLPSLVVVKPNDTVSCPPARITFNNLSSPIDTSYKVIWDFGDGVKSNVLNPVHTYFDSGYFNVTLQITTPLGCYTERTFTKLVEIQPPPQAGFEYSPENPDNFNPNVFFKDKSRYAAQWEWYMNGKLVSNASDFPYTFPDTGLYLVQQVITHREKCQDTMTALIDVVPRVSYHMPNAFTPNADALNDFFKGTGILRGAKNFKMEIWNRWGQMLYESQDPLEGWDGRAKNSNEFVPAGVYVCIVKFEKPRGELFEYKGFVTVLR
jgi:gliding motility-associated-like protein